MTRNTCLLTSLLLLFCASTLSAWSKTPKGFIPLELVAGSNSLTEAFIHKDDQGVNFAKEPAQIRFRVRTQNLVDNSSRFSSVKVIAYETSPSTPISITNMAIGKSQKANASVGFYVPIGYFASDSKVVFFDLYDAKGDFIATYKSAIAAENLSAQEHDQPPTISNSTCDNTVFGDCQIRYLLNNVNFEAAARRNLVVKTEKDFQGKYRISVPVLVKSSLFTKTIVKNKSGAAATADVDTLFADVEALNRVFTPNATSVSVRVSMNMLAGTTTEAPMQFPAGTLLAAPTDGALEFDGTRFYITTGGTRRPLAYTTDITTPSVAEATVNNLTDGIYNSTAKSIYIGSGSGTAQADTNLKSTAFGVNALNLASAAQGNTAFGYHGLAFNTTGSANVAIGRNALEVNTTGLTNTAVGAGALQSNTIGNGNVALGTTALSSNITGDYNVAIGRSSLRFSTTSGYNVGVGTWTLYENTTGNGNTALGHSAMSANTTGRYNVAVGLGSLYHNQNGSTNTAVGVAALQNIKNGDSNVAIGRSAMVGGTADRNGNTAIGNTAVGQTSLAEITRGNNNTVLGRGAGSLIDSGNGNIALGYFAGRNLTTGNGNITIGYILDAISATGNDQLNIGNAIYGDLSTDYVGLGSLASIPTAPLDISGDTLRLRTARTPASAADLCNQGDIAWDSDYIYICTATDTWKRSATTTW